MSVHAAPQPEPESTVRVGRFRCRDSRPCATPGIFNLSCKARGRFATTEYLGEAVDSANAEDAEQISSELQSVSAVRVQCAHSVQHASRRAGVRWQRLKRDGVISKN